jgi:2-iminobutanoate/2-iminopropanoate deaminase
MTSIVLYKLDERILWVAMRKEVIKIKGVMKPPSSFSHVVKAGGFLFLTSQLSCDLKTGMMIGGTIHEQTERALDNLKFLLESSGSSMEQVVMVRVYMRDVSKFKEMDSIYSRYFKEGEEPARVTVQAKDPVEGVDIEIEATAIVDGK